MSKQDQKRVGIFAGTFDPIHNGHIAFAQAALDCGLDKVYFLTEPKPRRKQGVKSLEHRRKMVSLAVADQPKMGSILYEKARLTPSESLPELKNRFGGAELHLLFGDDVISHMIDHIAEWPHIEELAKSAGLIIAARRHGRIQITKDLKRLKHHHGLPFEFTFVDPLSAEVSSSAIRRQLKQRELSLPMPMPALDYALKTGLYSSDSSSD